MTSMEISNITRNKLRKMFADGKRFDGRALNEHRDFEISYEVSNCAEGSARVKLGKTDVVVGIKLGIGEPYPDSPDKGNLVVSGDLLPLASPRFEMGPPKFNAIELPRLVDRAIRESKMIEMEKLIIKEGEKVWVVYIDIYPINDDGNIIDASILATIAALKRTMMPELDKNDKIDYEKESKKKLPLAKDIAPITFSFYKLGDSLIVDPIREEEEACEAKISWGVSKIDGEHFINSCQKGLEVSFSIEEIEEMMKMLPKKFEEVNEKLKKFLEK